MGSTRNMSAIQYIFKAETVWLLVIVLFAMLHASPPEVDTISSTTLTGKVMCGYQGWFNAEGDGAGRGFVHWAKQRDSLAPGNAKFDLWPDVSELGAAERFPTGFKLADGRTAEVFSSFKQATVLRHFQWMRDYGIDGAFVQRFITDLRDPAALKHCNTVLENCREGAKRTGRVYAVMYDLSGLGANSVEKVMDDWRTLRTEMRVTEDSAYYGIADVRSSQCGEWDSMTGGAIR